MSDRDNFVALGRAHAALKTAKSNVATLAASLGEYSIALGRASYSLDRFLDDPAKYDPAILLTDETKPSPEIQDRLRGLATAQAVLQIAELREEMGRVRQLEEEIDQWVLE